LFVTQPDRESSPLPRFINFQTPSALFAPKADDSSTITSFIPHNVDAILQAGSLGIVIDQNGRGLYYATHLSLEFVGFVRQNALTELTKLQVAPADLRFPKGSLQLKSSWKVVGPGDDASRFFTIRTVTPVFNSTSHGEIVVDPTNVHEETLALVGLHVVGVVEGHPEFIWATFEHNDNAPDLPVGLSAQTSQAVDTTRSWSLYARGTRAVDCNKKPENSTFVELFGPRKQTSPAPVSVFREFAFGGDNEPDVIRSLNDSVHRQLPSELAVWKNYSFMGAMWLNDPERDFRENEDFNGEAALHPDKKVLGGDVKLSNATMETFTQSIQNCFSCHNTMAKSVGKGFYVSGKRLNMSHALTSAYRYLLPAREKVMVTRNFASPPALQQVGARSRE